MLGAVMAQRAARRGFDALNRRNIDDVLRAFDDDAILIVPSRTIMGGRFEGKPAIEAWYGRWLHRMNQVRFTVHHVGVADLTAMGATNTVMVEWELDEVDTQERSFHFTGVTVFDIRRGKIVRQQEYTFEQDQMREVWPKA